jgi:hypothetical protein
VIVVTPFGRSKVGFLLLESRLIQSPRDRNETVLEVLARPRVARAPERHHFVEAAYREILGRNADLDSLNHYRQVLRTGVGRTAVFST